MRRLVVLISLSVFGVLACGNNNAHCGRGSGGEDPGVKAAVSFVKQLGGQVDWELLWLDLNDTRITNRDLSKLAPLKDASILELRRTKITDTGLKELTVLPNLEMLVLEATEITDDGIPELRALKKLRMIRLARTKITGKTLRALAGLEQLRGLELEASDVTDKGLNDISMLERLTSLNLRYTNISDTTCEKTGWPEGPQTTLDRQDRYYERRDQETAWVERAPYIGASGNEGHRCRNS